MRLHELAKSLDADSKRVLEIAKELGLGVKSHSSNLPAGTEGILRAAWMEELEEQKAEEQKARAKEAADEAVDEPEEEAGTLKVTIGSKAEEPEVEAQPEAPAEEEPAEPEAVAEEAAAAVPEETAEEPQAPAEEQQPPVAEEEGEPVAETEMPDEAPSEDDEETPKEVSITFAGQPQKSEPEEDAPADAGAERGDATGDEAADDGAKQIGVPNVPKSRERKGAKILGRIELSPQDTQRARRDSPAYDPLDPTRPMPERKEGGEGRGREPDTRGKSGRPKGGGGDFVFDPEDNSTLSAIRLGHFGSRRRPPVRRPPMRRRGGGGRIRKSRKPVERPTHPVTVRPPIGVRDLAEVLGIKVREILGNFPDKFDPRDKNAVLEEEHLIELGVALDREITVLEAETEESRMLSDNAELTRKMAGEQQPRPPVVAVMGHVDHGKTSLLDALRKSNLTSKEAGGITQKSSAYSVTTKSGARVTMIDTPGHKAFTEMRARGASVTDVAVLVVAADDGVMEQTKEAIDHANAAEVPFVVAINKIDKSNADTMKVRQQLAQESVLVEDYGGEVGVVECSATTGQGLDDLVERLALETEILELTADPRVPARGVVIDSTKDPQLGIVATVIVQDGTLRPKDAVLAGSAVGRVRWMLDDHGKRVKEAGPSTPVQVVGFAEPPEAGSRLMVVKDEKQARAVVDERRHAARAEDVPEAAVDAVTLDNLFETIESQAVTEINVLLKADNMGSLEVLKRTVEDVTHDEVKFKVIRTAVGGVTEDDVLLASASDAFIIGFGVVADARARAAIQRTGVDVKFYDVIYEMQEDLEKALEGELGTESVEEVTGHATVRAIFKSSKFGTIAGCYVTDGSIFRESRVRLVRDGTVIYTGRLDSLRRFKDDVREVRENYECGLHIDGYNDIKEEDVLEAFSVTEVKRTLDSPSPAKSASETSSPAS